MPLPENLKNRSKFKPNFLMEKDETQQKRGKDQIC